MLQLSSNSLIWGYAYAAAKHDYNHADVCLCWRQASRKEKIMLCVLNEYPGWRKGVLAAHAEIPKVALNKLAELRTAL